MTRPTSSLLLRPWQLADVVRLREAIDEDVDHLRPWLGWAKNEPAPPDETERMVLSWIDDYGAGRGLRFAITPHDDPWTILGGAGLNRRLGPAEFTLGFWVRKSATRKGIATAAAAGLICHAFNRLGLDRVIAEFDEGNDASMAVAEQLGFTWVGRFSARYPDGSPRSVVRYGLSRGGVGGQYWRVFEGLSKNVALDLVGEAVGGSGGATMGCSE